MLSFGTVFALIKPGDIDVYCPIIKMVGYGA